MKYLYLLYADESQSPKPGSPEMQAQMDAYDSYFKEITEKDLIRGGDPIQPSVTAKTVRVRDGATKTGSGPFAAGKEQIIGFYVVDCRDEAQALEYAAKVPAARHGAIEVRPIWQM
jgi:hypothetical protein